MKQFHNCFSLLSFFPFHNFSIINSAFTSTLAKYIYRLRVSAAFKEANIFLHRGGDSFGYLKTFTPSSHLPYRPIPSRGLIVKLDNAFVVSRVCTKSQREACIYFDVSAH